METIGYGIAGGLFFIAFAIMYVGTRYVDHLENLKIFGNQKRK